MELRRKKIRIGDLLVENGVISHDQLMAALGHQKTTGQKIGEALITLGFVSDSKLQAFLAQQRRKVRIGDALVGEGVISEEQLKNALDHQKKSGVKLGQAIVQLGYLNERQFLEFLANELDLPYVDLRTFQFNHDTVMRLPEGSARRFRAIALAEGKDGFLVGMSDPTDIFLFDELCRVLKTTPRLALVSEADLLRTLDRIYRRTGEIAEQAEVLGEEVSRSQFDLNQYVQAEMVVDAPVVKILQSLFEDAVQTRASDIHIEPDEDVLRIRQRIDGVLHEQIVKEKLIAPALVSKLKLMAGMEISEKRLPQDGRINLTVKNRKIDVRISTLPVQYGESVVMRLLDQSGGNLRLEQVGMPADLMVRFRELLHKPHGLILVTGPTGSGKTTTLYGALNELNSPTKKIITVEDPVEYRLPRISQVHVKPKIGLTFASVLRTVLRQDPDICLVGEMRDQETAEIAIRAALTGHLVLSTLHTNDAVRTAIRLVEMGVQGYAVAAALLGIVAQRLVRRVCKDCAQPHELTDQELAYLRRFLGSSGNPEGMRFVRGKGCAQCNQTGYMGRVAVVELLEMRRSLGETLSRNDTVGFMRAARKLASYRPLEFCALDRALEGLTTLDEVIRLTAEFQNEEDDEENESGFIQGERQKGVAEV